VSEYIGESSERIYWRERREARATWICTTGHHCEMELKGVQHRSAEWRTANRGQLRPSHGCSIGLTPQLIDLSLYGAFGQAQISTIYASLNQYHVVMEAAPQYTQNPLGMNSTYVHPSSGNAVPLDAFVKTTNSTSPLSINHDGLFPAVTVSFNLAPGVSLQQATVVIEKLQQRLAIPRTVRGGFADTAGDFKKSLIDQILQSFEASKFSKWMTSPSRCWSVGPTASESHI
jgi:multidrug efflux pump subunit AcrB